MYITVPPRYFTMENNLNDICCINSHIAWTIQRLNRCSPATDEKKLISVCALDYVQSSYSSRPALLSDIQRGWRQYAGAPKCNTTLQSAIHLRLRVSVIFSRPSRRTISRLSTLNHWAFPDVAVQACNSLPVRQCLAPEIDLQTSLHGIDMSSVFQCQPSETLSRVASDWLTVVHRFFYKCTFICLKALTTLSTNSTNAKNSPLQNVLRLCRD